MSRKGYKQTEEHKVKLGQSKKKEKNPNWKGGISKHTDGYILMYMPEHPFANFYGYVFEHRLVYEEYLRENEPNHPALIEINGEKYLRPEWVVHHNGIKYPISSYENIKDNRIENLELFINNGEHLKFHRFLREINYALL